MRLRSLPLLAACAAAFSLPPAAAAADTVTGQVVVTANFATRTSLKVSTQFLQFDVTAAGDPATVAVEFSAGVRAPSGAEVVLSVESLREIDSGGAADVETAVSFSGVGAGTGSGVLAHALPAVAGRWIGSGLRTGRMVFTLRASAAGSYTLPVRFVLSTP